MFFEISKRSYSTIGRFQIKFRWVGSLDFSHSRSLTLMIGEPEWIPFHFLFRLLLKDCSLPYEHYGHVILLSESVALLYRVSTGIIVLPHYPIISSWRIDFITYRSSPY